MSERARGRVIRFEGLTKRFGDLVAVNELELEIGRELFIFLGPNGAGKTTTIRMACGLLRPTSGRVILDGVDVWEEPERAKRRFTLVPEEIHLFEKLTGWEFLRFVGAVYGLDPAHGRRRAEMLLELFDLRDRARDLIQSYSQGMKRKMALCAALLPEPRVLFLDEPTIGLDPKSARTLKDLLRGLVEEKGVSVFMSTHILEIAENMCDRVGIIHRGRLIAVGSMEELRAHSRAGDRSLEDILLELTGGPEYEEVRRFLAS
ncbi:MAG: ABC transporter ATP-binding protein [candidate division KSB1 bacterium]|nr:ABC transporter ATP-binding protein [candidate division KSB1 bacterium]